MYDTLRKEIVNTVRSPFDLATLAFYIVFSSAARLFTTNRIGPFHVQTRAKTLLSIPFQSNFKRTTKKISILNRNIRGGRESQNSQIDSGLK